jgi:hypothetical protein
MTNASACDGLMILTVAATPSIIFFFAPLDPLQYAFDHVAPSLGLSLPPRTCVFLNTLSRILASRVRDNQALEGRIPRSRLLMFMFLLVFLLRWENTAAAAWPALMPGIGLRHFPKKFGRYSHVRSRSSAVGV